MKLINLGDTATNELLSLSETGMGFQLVEATVWGERRKLLVFNTEHAVDLTELDLPETEDPFQLLRNERKITAYLQGQSEVLFMAPQPHSFELLSSRISASATSPSAALAATSSSLVKHVKLKGNRTFYRFSAFKPDRRVNPATGDFMPGTYATVDSELPFVPTGFVAVGRFALPNNLPASYRYEIEAPAGTSVSFGTVAPAFSQAGGGVEAYFGSKVLNQANPMCPVKKIPDE